MSDVSMTEALALRITRAIDGVPARGVWFGAGLPEAVRATLSLGNASTNGGGNGQVEVPVAILEVTAIDAAGRCDAAPLPVRAGVVWGLAPTLRFSATPLAGPPLDRVFASDATLSFDLEGWRVREVGLGVSARDLQLRSPFGLVAGADLGPLIRT